MIPKPLAIFLCATPFLALASEKPIKVFVLAGDELVLEQGLIDGRTDGVFEDFYPNAEEVAGEERKHVNCAVYAGAHSAATNYDNTTPLATALVELGEQRTRQIQPGKRGREPVPFTPFPEVAMKEGHTTVLRGWVEAPYDGHYEFRAGAGDSAFNVTAVNGVEAYRREPGQTAATVSPVCLKPGQRHAFRTVFFGKPGHAFRIPLLDIPGALTTAIAKSPEYAFLRGKDGTWAKRDDVVLFDAHPIHNNAESFLEIGKAAGNAMHELFGIASPR